jgi:mannan endo-1,4-beta-mannosidase
MIPFLLVLTKPASFNVSAKLVTPGATASAIKLYNFIKSNFLQKSISGVMTTQGDTANSFQENNFVYETTGRYPVITGLDFTHHVGANTAWYTSNQSLLHSVVNDATNYWHRGGIPTLSWHWRDPSHESPGYDSPDSGGIECHFDASKAVNTSTKEYQLIIRDLDIIAVQLLDLQSRGVAALFRPLHEASGRWFWWGYKGPEVTKKLYRIMYYRFVNHHQIKNLIWVWTTGFTDKDLNWYPGDDVVDILGLDIYVMNDHSPQDVAFKKVRDMFGGRKIVALSECGSIPGAKIMQSSGALWSYFVPWNQKFVIPEADVGDNFSYNSVAFWKSQMSDPFVLTLEKMPGW